MRPLPQIDPALGDARAADLIEHIILPRARDLGGFTVGRVLPSVERQMVGPFIFLDTFGPGEMLITEKFDVRPHPHIGLATVTYINAGRIVHRDSVGSLQEINPGDVNWMTAGRGIAHSERARPEDVGKTRPVGGFQTWVALPKDQEEAAPAFAHHGKAIAAGDRRGRRHRARSSSAASTASGRRSRPSARCSTPTFNSRPARRCRSIPTMRSGPPIFSTGRSRSPATGSRRGGSWCSGRATGSRSRR